MPTSRRARYRDIATALRGRITDGTYPAGEAIPRQVDLAREFNASHGVIEQAVSLLAQEGYLAPVKGHGTYVRDRSRVRLNLARYRKVTAPGGARGPWETATAEHGINGHAELILVDQRDADPTIATLLGVAAGARVVHRRRHMHAGAQIAQIQHQYLPLELVEGTPLAAREKVVGGVYGALTGIGHPPAAFSEAVVARRPTHEEAAVMRLGPGAPVLEVVRTTTGADGRVLEAVIGATDGERVQVAYEDLPLTGK